MESHLLVGHRLTLRRVMQLCQVLTMTGVDTNMLSLRIRRFGGWLCRFELLPITLLFVLVLAVLLGPALVGRKVFLPADIYYTDGLWQSLAPAGFQQPANPLLSDWIFQYYPFHLFFRQAIEQYGQIPLWNPFIFMGQPFVANAQSGVFYPINWLSLLMPVGAFFGWAAALRLYLAALFTYLFLRANGAGRPASLLSGLAYALSGPLIVWLNAPLMDVFLWLPATLWALHHVFGAKRPARWLVVLALVLGLQGLAGHFQSYFHVLVVTVAYAVFRLWFSRRPDRWRIGAGTGLAIVAGLALCAVQALPFIEYTRESGTLLAGGRSSVASTDRWWYSPTLAPNLAAAVTLLWPDFYGNPATHDAFWPLQTYQNYNEQAVYVGTLPLLLALVTLGRRWRKERLFFLAVAVVSFGVAFRLPLFEVVNHLPVFSLILNKRLRFVTAFSLAVLAGFGANEFFEPEGKCDSRGLARRLVVASVILTLSLAAWYLFLHLLYGNIVTPGWPESTVNSLMAVFRLDRVRTYVPSLVTIVAALLFSLHACRRLSRRGLAVSVLVLTGAELVFLGYHYCPLVSPSALALDTPAVDYLRQLPQPIRVLGVGQTFRVNMGIVTGIPAIGGYDLPVSRRLAGVYTRLGGKNIHSQRWDTGWPLLDVCGVQYVVGAAELSPDRYELIYDGEVRIYRLRQALPRVFSVSHVEAVATEEEAFDRLFTEFDHQQTAVVEAGPGDLPNLEFSPAEGLTITRYEPNRVSVEAHMKQQGFVVLADAYDDDWRATIDGRPTHIFPTDYLLRGVVVPAGTHTIEFVYSPLSLRLGLVVSLLTLVSLVLTLAVSWKRATPVGEL